MKIRLGLISYLAFAAMAAFAQNAPIVIRAGQLIDGKGGVTRNVTIVVEGTKIKSIGQSTQKPTYDFSTVTVMPGMIDTHVHLETHFGKDDKATTAGETPQQTQLY